MKTEHKPMSFRPDEKLRKMIEDSAKKNTRDLAHEIIHRLTQSFKRSVK